MEVFPHGLPICNDGCGNYWVLDLIPGDTEDVPVFFASHDAPAIVYQASSIAQFLEQVLSSGKEDDDEISSIANQAAFRIWHTNPNVLSYEACLSADDELQQFARSLDDSWQFIDLRNAKPGDGFSWARYGADTPNRRWGSKRIFAYQMDQEDRQWVRVEGPDENWVLKLIRKLFGR
jgi:hypothetical protein